MHKITNNKEKQKLQKKTNRNRERKFGRKVKQVNRKSRKIRKAEIKKKENCKEVCIMQTLFYT